MSQGNWSGARGPVLALACAGAALVSWADICRAEIPLADVLKNVRIEQRVGQSIPPGLVFSDEQGRRMELGRYFGQRPAVLAFVYYNCPNLCPMLLRHLTEGLNGIGLAAGRDFDVVIVSMDPADTAELGARLKLGCVRAYRYPGESGWHFLTGTASQISRLEEALGFHCLLDAQRHHYAHPLGAMVIGPGGLLSHDFFGVDFSPADLEAALKDAAAGRFSRAEDAQQQFCMDYSPTASRYGRIAVYCLRALAALWVLLLLAYIGRELARDWRKSREGRPI